MSIEIMKMLIQSACSEGTLNDSDRKLLEKKASDFGISQDKLNDMIEAELNGSNSTETQSEPSSDEGSGFITENPVQNSTPAPTPQPQKVEENLAGSGFITEAPVQTPPQNISTASTSSQSSFNSSMAVSSRFTDVSLMSSQGAMSSVYQGKQYGKWIIIKRIKPQFKNNEDYKNLFFKEFENAYHLDHPNIVRILDKGEDEEGAYYTMEYVDGQTLTELIKSGKTQRDERLTKKLFSQMLDALTYVHKKQIIHRDLKPDNMIVTYKGDNVKILDFGLASADNFDDDLIKVGTPKYAAPEQLTKGNEADQRADIYALGLILLEMVTGSLTDRNADTVKNPNYQEIIRKCTKQNRDERFYDCQEILEVLNRPIPATPVTPVTPPVTPPVAPTPKEAPKPAPQMAPASDKKVTPIVEEKKKKSPILFIILGILLIGGLVAFLLLRNSGEKPIADNNNKQENVDPKPDNNNQQNQGNQNNQDNQNNQQNQDNQQNNQNNGNNQGGNNNPQQSEEDAECSALTKQGNACFDDKNVARALTFYNKALAINPNYSQAKEKAEKCNQLLNATSTKNLTKQTGASPDGKNQTGFIDANGYVLIDYLYDDEYASGFKTDNGLVVKKNGGIEIISNKTKLSVESHTLGNVYSTGSGFRGKDKSGNRWEVNLK